jgi:hypothetical protein
LTEKHARHVTDHALIRYLERVKGFDLEPHRAAIRSIVANAPGSARTVLHQGFRYELGNLGAVTTVTPNDGGICATRKRRLIEGARP